MKAVDKFEYSRVISSRLCNVVGAPAITRARGPARHHPHSVHMIDHQQTDPDVAGRLCRILPLAYHEELANVFNCRLEGPQSAARAQDREFSLETSRAAKRRVRTWDDFIVRHTDLAVGPVII